jgi:predicted RNA-binding protein with PUA-like domain
MRYWLLKSEPSVYSIDDLARERAKTTLWEGVRNYQARNYLREMSKGDQAFFYHSSCDVPGVVGIVEIVRAAYPDPTCFDPTSRYHDPKSDADNPRWSAVDVRLKRKLQRTISLAELRQDAKLDGLALLGRGNRLSVMPVAGPHWRRILARE